MEYSGDKMKGLTRKEELLILTILNLKKDAYPTAITAHLTKVTSKKVSLTSVHAPLSRMEKHGVMRNNGPIGVMLSEHIEGRSRVRAMKKAASRRH